MCARREEGLARQTNQCSEYSIILCIYTFYINKFMYYQPSYYSYAIVQKEVEHISPRFSGKTEEDAQEFITFLLDELSKDLDKIVEKYSDVFREPVSAGSI